MLKRFFRTILCGCAAGVLALSVAGCSGSSGAGAISSGEVVIGLTDADGDFVTYQVDVTSLTLTNEGGDVLETAPAVSTVDFSQYTELTEFFTTASVPLGTYTEATLHLDYANANVMIEVNGEAVPVTVLGTDGEPLAQAAVTVTFRNDRRLEIRARESSHLILDFDLAASHRIDLADPANPVVEAEPFLLANIDPDTFHPYRLRGTLKEVNPASDLFQVNVLPFHHQEGEFGVFPVKTDADTHFEIDGIPYMGAAGLAVLARLPAGAPVVARGEVNRTHRHLRASRVWAGSSVAWGRKTAVTGIVTARVNGDYHDELTIRWASLVHHPDGPPTYLDTSSIWLFPETTVTRAGTEEALDIDAISVGQRITALGSPNYLFTTDMQPEMPEPPHTHDILFAEHVRMDPSGLTGQVVENQPGVLTVALHTLNGHLPEQYDFTGTGASVEEDADPAAYQIDYLPLILYYLDPGDPVRIRGHVTPFGTAPSDFTAEAVWTDPALIGDPEPVPLSGFGTPAG